MAAVNNVDLGVRNILAVAVRLARVKRCFVFAPDHQQPWLLFAHPLLPFRIGIDVGSVVVEKVALYLSLAGPIQKIKFVGPEVGIVALHVGIGSDVSRTCGLERQEIVAQCALIGSAISPERPARFPICSQAAVVGDGVLHDQRFDSLRMLQCHAKADGATVVLHVKGIARESERLGEMVHGLSQMVEGVCESPRVRPVTVSEPGIIRRYQVIAIGKPCEKRLEHPRRRWKAVEQEERFRICRPGLSIEDRKAVDPYCAVKGAIHRWFLSFSLGWASSPNALTSAPAPRKARSE